MTSRRAALALACAAAASGPLACAAPPATLPVGSAWQIERLGADPVIVAAPGRSPSIEWGPAERVSGSTGCNRFSGQWSQAGDTVTLSRLVTTRMACPDMDLERRFTEALSQVARWRMIDGRLELLDAGGTPVMRLVRTAAPR